MVIQAYLLNAPAVCTELETWRVDLTEQVASAVSARADLAETRQTVALEVPHNFRARCGTEACLHVRRFHAHEAQHKVDLTPVADFVLLYTMNKNPSSCPPGWKWVLRPGAGVRAAAGQNRQCWVGLPRFLLRHLVIRSLSQSRDYERHQVRLVHQHLT